jgi:hypothetical protein
MSTADSGTSSAGAAGDGAAPRRWRSPGAVGTALIVTGVTALALRVYLVFRVGLMSITQYDDGPYFGSAVRLIHGVLPYRGYAFVQPPGITLVMSPAALESYVGGTAWALVAGRFLSVLAGAAAVVLAGLLVRHRGVLAVLLTCGIMTIYPPAAAASRTVLLEPWLVLFCLAGAVAVFDGDRITASTRRLAWGGVLFGFAGAIKVWAIVPVLVLAVLCLPRIRRAAVFAGGVAAGFLVPVLPFALAAPGRFYDDVVVAQLARIGSRTPAWHRFNSMMGTPKFLTEGSVVVIAIALVAFVVLTQVAAWRVTRRPPPSLDWFAVATAALVVLMFLWPPYFASHYSAFFGPFLALTLALPVSRLVTGVASRLAERRRAAAGATSQGPGPRRAPGPWLARSGLILLGAAIVAGAAAQVQAPSRWTTRIGQPAVTLRLIPRGSCVVTDSAVYLLIANRFTSTVPGCSQMVDSLGTDLALSDGHRPGSGAGRVAAVNAAWRQAFSTAGWVLLSPKSPVRVPWNPALLAYFHSHFRLARHLNTYYLYQRRA